MLHDTDDVLLFVCGFPSGGTDLVKTILNAHPAIHINGEMPRLSTIAKLGYGPDTTFDCLEDIFAFQSVLERLNDWNNISNLHHDFSSMLLECSQLSMQSVLKVCFSDVQRLVWGNKTPQNTENIAALHSLFPSARFLIVTRDVRDVCLSWNRKWGKDEIDCARKWTSRMLKGWDACQHLSADQYHFVRYEELLLDSQRACGSICRFLEVPFSAAMLEHHKHTDAIPDGKLKYGQQIDSGNMEKWRTRLPAQTVRRIEEISFDTMRLFGYSPAFAAQAMPVTVPERVWGELCNVWASLAVGNRASRSNSFRSRLRSTARQVIDRLYG